MSPGGRDSRGLADSAFLPAWTFHVTGEEKVCALGRAGKAGKHTLCLQLLWSSF